MHRDFLCAFLMTAIILFFGMQLSGFSEEQSIIVPRFILIFMGLINVCQYIQAGVRYFRRGGKTFSLKGYPVKRMIVLSLLTIFYIMSLEIAGFYLSSFLYLLLTSLIAQPMAVTTVGVAKRTMISFTCIAFLYLLFTVGLAVQIPRGFLNF